MSTAVYSVTSDTKGDALIITAAASANCNEILTEDLNHGQVIQGVRIKNPFV